MYIHYLIFDLQKNQTSVKNALFTFILPAFYTDLQSALYMADCMPQTRTDIKDAFRYSLWFLLLSSLDHTGCQNKQDLYS